MADDDDEGFEGAYENGHWVWDDTCNGLSFLRNLKRESVATVINVSGKVTTGTMTFKDDVDLIQQLRFTKQYARRVKPGQPDIITLQDIKDLALFTAPLTLLSPGLINLLHVPTTERFIRALILYCQYYLQVEDNMAKRIEELEKKVRTPDSVEVEAVFRENLSDLRALVTKEYSIILVEQEVNRIFKTDNFNPSCHRITEPTEKMHKLTAKILLGETLRHDAKLKSSSPLMNEVTGPRHIDYRMMGLGLIQYDELDQRQRYMLLAVAAPESELLQETVTVGILGLPRTYFDTMLNVLPTALENQDKRSSVMSSTSRASSRSRASGLSTNKSFASAGGVAKEKVVEKFIYGEVVLPPRKDTEPALPESFPVKAMPIPACNETQRIKWLGRLCKLLGQHRNKSFLV